MKTTLDLDEQVLRRARGRAAQDETMLTKFVEDALRARLAAVGSNAALFRVRGKPHRPPRFQVASHPLGLRPGVDGDRLNQLVDELESEGVARRLGR